MASQNPLRDITIRTNNLAGRSSSSQSRIAISKPLPLSADEKLSLTSHTVDARPHYMMPTSASRSQTHSESGACITPPTLNSLDSGTSKRKIWMASASKRLGISNTNIKPSDIGHPTLQHPALSPYPALRRPDMPSQIPRKQLKNALSPQSSPVPRLTAPDKPLPSLPVATITSKSPINRRSLIDATERPLRRSLSPQFGPSAAEEWPALSPVRPASTTSEKQPPPTIKPSVGESVIEGIRGLSLGDDPLALPSRPDARINVSKTDDQANIDPILEARCTTPLDQDLSEPSTKSSALHESLQSETAGALPVQHKQPPIVRQTKTSAMRLRMLGGSIDESDGKSTPSHTGPGLQHLELGGVSPGDLALPMNDDASGSERVNAYTRYAATPRGSPYLVSSRSKAQIVDIQRKPSLAGNPTCSTPAPRIGSDDSTEEFRQSKVVVLNSAKSFGSGKRYTSIPLPSRLIRRFPDEDSEGDVSAETAQKISASYIEADPHDADTDTGSKLNSTRHAHKADGGNMQAIQQSNKFTFSELMATPPPAVDEHGYSSDSSEGSIRGYDEDGGFKVKKLHRKGGATLRISDDAHRLLSPEQEGAGDALPKSGTRLCSGKDLRQAVVLKEHLRRSSGALESQVELTRNRTERSLARLSGANSNKDHGGSVDDFTAGEDAGDIDHSQGSPGEFPNEPVVESGMMSSTLGPCDGTGVGSHVANPASAIGQGDWPMKDFKIMASTDEVAFNVNASNSPWIPPMDWDVDMAQGDTSAISDTTPCPSGPPDTPSSDANAGQVQRKPSDRFSIASERIPTPKPSQVQSAQFIRPPSTDSVKRPFPPRSTSKQTVPQQHPIRMPNFLSPVKESPEQLTGYHQTCKSYRNQLKQFPESKPLKTFSESIEDINQTLEAAGPTSPATPVPPTTASVKKRMSTLRNLFQKNYHEFGLGSHRAKKYSVAPKPGSSAPLATHTPYNNLAESQKGSLRIKGFSQPLSVAVPPALAKTTVHRKPLPNFKSADNSPLLENAILEPPEIRAATQTALKILGMAREERNEERQDLLVELGKATIEVVNAARDAEKAVEQAKQAAAKAEIKALESKKAVAGVVEVVEKLVTGE